MMQLMNKNLTKLIIDNREKMSILFNGSENTKYESIKYDLIDFLINLVVRNYKVENVLLLRIIFENLINMISDVFHSVNAADDLSKFLMWDVIHARV